jgi:hypothetical protein
MLVISQIAIGRPGVLCPGVRDGANYLTRDLPGDDPFGVSRAQIRFDETQHSVSLE